MPVATGKDFQTAMICRPYPLEISPRGYCRSQLSQAGAPKPFQIMRPVRLVLERQSGREPRERDVGLGAAELWQRGFGGVSAAGHAEGSGQHAVGADKIASLAQRFTREADPLRVIAADILAIGGDAAIDRGKGIAG